MIPHCNFVLHFSNNYQYSASFHVPVGHLYVFLDKFLFRSSAHFSIGLVFFVTELYELFVDFGN